MFFSFSPNIYKQDIPSMEKLFSVCREMSCRPRPSVSISILENKQKFYCRIQTKKVSK